MSQVKRDSDFLLANLKSVIETDVFTAELVRIYKHVLAEGAAQEIALSIHRSDYMLHKEKGVNTVPVCKQVIIYIYIYTYIYTHIYIYVIAPLYIHTHTYIYIYIIYNLIPSFS